MHKSSVYLPQELKDRLAGVAVRSGRSEADLIRSAIEQLVSSGPSPVSVDLRPIDVVRPSLLGVGMGPGDPALVTARARGIIAVADRVIVLTTDVRSVGRAEMVVRAVAPDAPVRRVPFAIGADDSARRRSLLDLADAVAAGTDAGEAVAVAMLGDPSQWTTFPALAAELAVQRPELHIEGVAGISSYQNAAAHGNIALGAAGAPLIVVDNVVDLDVFLARGDATVVLFKAATDAEALQQVAASRHRDGVVAELIGLPGERTTSIGALAPGPISYLATVVFPAASRDRAVVR